MRHPDLWNENTLRTQFPQSPHHAVDDVWVFFNDVSNPEAVPNEIQTHPCRAWIVIPQIRPLIFDLMRRVEGVQLGRVLITRLPPGKAITPHADGGAPVEFYSRYQIVLQSQPGVIFRVGDERAQWKSGDVWLIRNDLEHEVINGSADDRLAMVVDIRTC
jgi:aspartyl/asparaginyl beta-hydroxylase (cupin superfamily)